MEERVKEIIEQEGFEQTTAAIIAFGEMLEEKLNRMPEDIAHYIIVGLNQITIDTRDQNNM